MLISILSVLYLLGFAIYWHLNQSFIRTTSIVVSGVLRYGKNSIVICDVFNVYRPSFPATILYFPIIAPIVLFLAIRKLNL